MAKELAKKPENEPWTGYLARLLSENGIDVTDFVFEEQADVPDWIATASAGGTTIFEIVRSIPEGLLAGNDLTLDSLTQPVSEVMVESVYVNPADVRYVFGAGYEGRFERCEDKTKLGSVFPGCRFDYDYDSTKVVQKMVDYAVQRNTE